jgi:hypothetical protein
MLSKPSLGEFAANGLSELVDGVPLRGLDDQSKTPQKLARIILECTLILGQVGQEPEASLYRRVSVSNSQFVSIQAGYLGPGLIAS